MNTLTPLACHGHLVTLVRHRCPEGTASADRINDPSVPREMRSFAGINILWNGLSRLMTALPPEALQQLLTGQCRGGGCCAGSHVRRKKVLAMWVLDIFCGSLLSQLTQMLFE